MQEQPAEERDRELIAVLGTLKLPPPDVSQRDIWYHAGVQTGRRQANVWKGLAAIVTLGAALALALDHRPAPTPHVTYVQHMERPTTPDAMPAATPNASVAYERMRARLIEQGLSGLPPIDFSGDGGQSPPSEQRHADDREDLPQNLWYR